MAPALLPKRGSRSLSPIIWVLLGVLVVALIWAATYHPYFPGMSHPNQAAQIQTPPPPQPRLYTSAMNKAFTIPAMNFIAVPFVLPDSSSNVKMQGHFSATGGARSDIEVFLLSEDEFANWKTGHRTNAIYSSGRATQDTPNVVIPPNAGTYYLVFNNKFSLLSPKAVEANMTFTYYHL